MSTLFKLPVTLPCHPCPHSAVCCGYGTALTLHEALSITAEFGDAATVWDAVLEEHRTRVVDGYCSMRAPDGACRIYAKPYYPAVCRLFPWEDVDGGPYKYDLSICPECVPPESA